MTSLAGTMRRRGASEAAILAALVEENTRCDPPLDLAELKGIARSMARYQPKPIKAANRRPGEQCQAAAKEFIDGKTFIPPRLGRHILEQIPFLNLTKEKTTGHLHSYHDGVYLRDGAARVAELAGAILGDAYRDNRAEETIRWLEMKARMDPERANRHDGLVNVRNGMLDWQSGQLLPHDPEYLSTIQIPTEFDPGARCPQIETFLLTTLPDDCIEMTLEWLGYLLIPSTKQQKALMVVGPGENGKSTFLDFIRLFLGAQNVSGIPLQELAEHRFKRAELQGKLVNMFADLDAAALERSSYFKMIVTGDEIDAERKYGHPFTFKPFSRLIFSANAMPASYDRSKAFYRRWLIVPFPNCFEGDDADRDMLNKITTSQELSGLLNLAIEYLRKLTARGYFDEPATVVKAMNIYKQTSDPMAAFLEECCYTDDDKVLEVGKTALYEAYTEYCDNAKARYIEPRADFNSRLQEMYPMMIEHRKRVDERRIAFWRGGPGLLEP